MFYPKIIVNGIQKTKIYHILGNHIKKSMFLTKTKSKCFKLLSILYKSCLELS